MQPRVYSRDHIIDAAFELIREQGWSAVSTRAIAKKVGSSTMPIYSHMRSVEDLEKELRQRAHNLLKDFQQRQYTEYALLNLAFGYVVFARDEKNLFRFLYLEKPRKHDLEKSTMKDLFLADFGAESKAGKDLAELQDSGHETLISYTWIFTHGLATLVNSGALDTSSDETILRYLMHAGAAFYLRGNRKGGEELDKNGL
jgi:AcrR family transcriptional regulator